MNKKTIFGLLVISVLFFSGCVQQQTENTQGEYANSISDVKVEFIPQVIDNIRCKAGDICEVNFQVKNGGDKIIRIGAGEFSGDANLEKDVTILSRKLGSVTILPNEISQTISVNAFGRIDLDEGIYNIKIPLQIYDKMGNRIGESSYYLTGKVTYWNLPYCSSTVTNNCRVG